MKNNLRRMLSILISAVMILQVTAVCVFAEELPAYVMADDIKASGEQGYNGWYYMKDVNGTYKELEMWNSKGIWSKDGGSSGNFVSSIQINPEWNCPTIVAWKAPLSGKITLTTISRFYRISAGNGDVTATIKLNDNVLKQNDNNDAVWVFAQTANEADGHDNKYEITEVAVEKGDMIYHIADCGKNNSSPALFWRPKISYTYVDPIQPEEPKPEEPDADEILPEEGELTYKMSDVFENETIEQGMGGWYFMYYDTAKKDWAEMTVSGSPKRFVKYLDAAKTKWANAVYRDGRVQPESGSPTAIGWRVPMSGTVKLTTDVSIRKASAGAATTASIIYSGKTIWSAEIPGDQINQASGEKPEIEIDVKCGDMIYFQISAEKTNSAETFWKPKAEYTQLAKFYAGDRSITQMTDISSGDSIKCLFYDTGKLEKSAFAYLAMYDKEGTMVRISEPKQLSGDGKITGRELSFAADFSEESYDGWELRLMLINGDGININPVRNPELYCVK